MTKSAKIILITTGLLAVGAGVAYAYRKKKVSATKPVLVTADNPVTTTETGSDVLKAGSTDEQHVLQLQEVLNTLHQSARYINLNCGGIKWGYMTSGNMADGKVVTENGKFDAKTKAAAKFYLNREEVDLWFLDLMRGKIAKYNKSDKCVYPMAIA